MENPGAQKRGKFGIGIMVFGIVVPILALILSPTVGVAIFGAIFSAVFLGIGFAVFCWENSKASRPFPWAVLVIVIGLLVASYGCNRFAQSAGASSEPEKSSDPVESRA